MQRMTQRKMRPSFHVRTGMLLKTYGKRGSAKLLHDHIFGMAGKHNPPGTAGSSVLGAGGMAAAASSSLFAAAAAARASGSFAGAGGYRAPAAAPQQCLKYFQMPVPQYQWPPAAPMRAGLSPPSWRLRKTNRAVLPLLRQMLGEGGLPCACGREA